MAHPHRRWGLYSVTVVKLDCVFMLEPLLSDFFFFVVVVDASILEFKLAVDLPFNPHTIGYFLSPQSVSPWSGINRRVKGLCIPVCVELQLTGLWGI